MCLCANLVEACWLCSMSLWLLGGIGREGTCTSRWLRLLCLCRPGAESSKPDAQDPAETAAKEEPDEERIAADVDAQGPQTAAAAKEPASEPAPEAEIAEDADATQQRPKQEGDDVPAAEAEGQAPAEQAAEAAAQSSEQPDAGGASPARQASEKRSRRKSEKARVRALFGFYLLGLLQLACSLKRSHVA